MELLRRAPHVPPLLLEIEGVEGEKVSDKMAEALEAGGGCSADGIGGIRLISRLLRSDNIQAGCRKVRHVDP